MRLSIFRRIMEIEVGVIADNTLLDLHNSSYYTKAEFNNCFIISLKKNIAKHAYLHRC